ncbi:hypothetical protein VU01_13631 [Candidatus Electrothrix marina]|uniref:Uncharacterized protein n=1 Tax=Candidatus Electrothrix marina TaxID=1859130 RepID=A0A444JAY1_9BACT|nr:hypothetical protein VU01_13631 [Candidatus Electrothrix marina]
MNNFGQFIGGLELLKKGGQLFLADTDQEFLKGHRTKMEILYPADRHGKGMFLQDEFQQGTGSNDVEFRHQLVKIAQGCQDLRSGLDLVKEEQGFAGLNFSGGFEFQ